MREIELEIARKGAFGLIAALQSMHPVDAANRVAARHRSLCKKNVKPWGRATVNTSKCKVTFE